MKEKLVISSSPHIWVRTSTSSVMRDMAIALLPALVAACYFFGWQALVLTLVCVASCVGFEFLYRLMMKLPQTIDDFSAVVTGMLLAFVLPASAPFWMGIIGSFVAIVIVKQIFGGLGKNFANPAAVGRIFLMLAFAANMASIVVPIRPEIVQIFEVETVSGATEQTAVVATEDTTSGVTEQTAVVATEDTTSGATEQTAVVTTEDTASGATEQTAVVATEDTTSGATEQTAVVATEDTASGAIEQTAVVATEDTTSNATDTISAASPLAVADQENRPSYLDLFLGRNIAGALGETCKLALLLGALYLVIRKVITPTIPLVYIAAVFATSALFGMDPLYQILSGGLILGACFMATDYATSPITMKGQIIFGVGCGFLTIILRKFSSMSEGVVYAIVLMNLFTPLIDRLCKTKPFGAGEKSEVAA